MNIKLDFEQGASMPDARICEKCRIGIYLPKYVRPVTYATLFVADANIGNRPLIDSGYLVWTCSACGYWWLSRCQDEAKEETCPPKS